MQDSIRLLVQLQQTDTRILEKRRYIDRVPLRISEVDEPLRNAKAELDKVKQKAEAAQKKKKDREKALQEVQDKIAKMKARTQDIKTNKEYQAHLREIESSEQEIAKIEDQILQVMNEVDAAVSDQQEREKSVKKEEEHIQSFRQGLDEEVTRLEQELGQLKEERAKIVSGIAPDLYDTYFSLLRSRNGVAIARAQNDICLGCDMNIPPQLTVEIRKGSDLVTCPQCRRILYCDENQSSAP